MGNHNANSLEMNGFMCAQQLILLPFANFTVLKCTLKKIMFIFSWHIQALCTIKCFTYFFRTDSNGINIPAV